MTPAIQGREAWRATLAQAAEGGVSGKLGFTELERFEAWGAERWLGMWSPVTPHS
jgi:hypothetical protein